MKIYKFFSKSMIAGCTYNITSFLFALVCGYIISSLLQAAIASDINMCIFLGTVVTVILFISIIPIYVLSKRQIEHRLRDKQAYLEFLYYALIEKLLKAESGGDIEIKLNKDAEKISVFYQEIIPNVFGSCIVFIISLCLLLIHDYLIAIIFFGFNLLQFLPTILYEKWAKKMYNRVRLDETAYCDWLIEGHNGIGTIKAYGVENWFMSKFQKLNNSVYISGKTAEKIGTVETMFSEMISAIINYGIYVVLGIFVLYGRITIDSTPILIVLGNYLFSSMSSVYDMRLAGFAYKEAKKRLELNDKDVWARDDEYLLSVNSISKSFEEKKILDGISFNVKAGEKIMLKGKNGSGKSTLLEIILKFTEADSGTVLYGEQLAGDNGYANIAFSMQEEADLNQSANDIVQGLVDIGEISENLFYKNLNGLELNQTLLTKNLNEFSMGERKKFFLAVAFSKPCELLILDEPTNHIDKSGQTYIVEQMRNSSAAMLVCCHNDLPIKWDRIIELDGGNDYEN